MFDFLCLVRNPRQKSGLHAHEPSTRNLNIRIMESQRWKQLVRVPSPHRSCELQEYLLIAKEVFGESLKNESIPQIEFNGRIVFGAEIQP